jgi:hypothetical protein
MPTPPRRKNAELHPTEAVPRLAFSIAEFCAAVGISVSTYARMRAQGAGPREARAWDGSAKVLITRAAADDWIAERARAAEEASAERE